MQAIHIDVHGIGLEKGVGHLVSPQRRNARDGLLRR
jgi:hypothetical protein